MVTTSVSPVSPDKLPKADKAFEIPPFIIHIVNKLIYDNWDGHQANVWMSDIVRQISIITGFDKKTILQKRWLDIETTYRRAGYKVNYVAPPPLTKGEAFFEFIEKE